MVGPVNKVNVAFLIVKWVICDVELTRGDELAAWHPVDNAIIGDTDPETLEEEFIVDGFGTAMKESQS